MNTKLDNRAKLVKIVKNLDEVDTQCLLAFTAGMDTGKKLINQHSYVVENSYKITK